MNHKFYTRNGNRYGLENFQDAPENFFNLIHEVCLNTVIPGNVLVILDDHIFSIMQTAYVVERNEVLYLLRKKGDNLIIRA